MKFFHEIEYIVIHCSATDPEQELTADDIRQTHKAKGWKDIGYHFVIRRDGTFEAGRSMTTVGAHVYGYNKVPGVQRPMSWGLCMVGGVDANGKSENNYTPDQWATLRNTLPGLMLQAPKAKVLGHRDLSPDIDGDGVIEPFEWLKDCPCFDVKKYCLSLGLTREAIRLNI